MKCGRLLPLSLLICALLFTLGCAHPAPGEAETAAPETPLPAIPSPETLQISEVMADNRLYPLDGQLCGWAELYNSGSESVSLAGYTLSLEGKPASLSLLPEKTLAAGEYLLLSCGQELSLTLPKKGCTLLLTGPDGREADRMEIPSLSADESFTREGVICSAATPGLPNDADNSFLFAPPDGLSINEVVTRNASLYQREGEEYPDLIELYNGGRKSVCLSDYSLADSRKSLGDWRLPDVTLRSGEHYLLCCGGTLPGDAPFSLSSEGETLYLTDLSGRILDLLSVPEIPADRSYGREDGKNRYFAVPTPGRANAGGSDAITAAPTASVPSGFYDEPFTVMLFGPGEIRYTLDGSTPDEYSTLYLGESILIEDYTSLRFRSFKEGCIPSDPVTCNYLLGLPEHELDVVVVSVSPRDFSGPLSAQDSLVRCPGNVALYADGREEFNIPCGVELFGSGSRIYEKRGYQVHFSTEYGPSALEYKLFDDREQNSFTSFNLRSGSQDLTCAMMRDELLTSLWGEISDSLMTFSYRPVVLYVNGDCRGIYFIREHCSKSTVAARTGADKDSVEILRSLNGPFYAGFGEDYWELITFLRSHDLNDESVFAEVESCLDIDSAIDFFLAMVWSNNYDSNNARLVRSNANGGRWSFILYDMDVAFYRDDSYAVHSMLKEYGGLYRLLLRNDSFRERMTLRLGELLSGPLQEELLFRRVDDFAALLRPDMPYNAARFPALNSMKKWEWSVEFLKTGTYSGIQGRSDRLIREYIDAVNPGDDLIRRAFGEKYCTGRG